MRAATYARKSTDDDHQQEENKSVTRQVEHARAFAQSKGWTVAAEHEYVDDGITGGEEGFKKRDGLKRMLNHLKDFDVIVMSELSRLGRHQVLTSAALHQIEKAGVQVWFYLTNEQCRFDTAVDRFLVSALGFAAELERERIGQRARDALQRKAAKGYNAGGAVFGYDNVPVYAKGVNGERVRSHTDYMINDEQAGVVRGIFRAYADGHGHTSIAKALNGNGSDCGPKGKRRRTPRHDLEAVRRRYFGGRTAPSPQRGKRGTGSWAPSAVREILYRVRYTGKVPFGEIATDRQELRIVDAELWERAQQRLREVRATYIRDGGQWWGRPSVEKYLLSGMGRCTGCGKSITVLYSYNGTTGNRQKVYQYGCSYNHTRGDVVCENDHRARMEWLDGAVIEAIEQQVLQPEAIAYTVEKAAEIIERELKRNPDKPQQLEAEARKLRRELERFLRLIAEGKAPDSVLVEIRRREERLKDLEREQAALVAAPPAWTPAEIRAMCGQRLRRFPELLHGDVPVARQALRKLLPEPLRIRPVTADGRRTLGFEGTTVLGPLFDPTHKGWATPRGFEPRLPP